MADETETHRRAVRTAYRRRVALLEKPFADAATLDSLESSLRRRLWLLATEDGAERTEQPDDGPETFLAVALASLRGADGEPWRGIAPDLLARGGETGQAAADALALLPVPLDESDFHGILRAWPRLLACLLDLCRRSGQKAPPGLVNGAELGRLDAEAQAAALAYGAERADCSAEVFRAYYVPLLARDGALRAIGERAAAAALWGGLLRGDSDALRALPAACRQAAGDGPRRTLLRLMALTGTSEYLPILRDAARHDPAYGMYLLGLHGSGRIMPDILDGLDRAASMDEAAHAWTWLTGQELPSKPRLGVVSGRSTGPARGRRPHDGVAREHWAVAGERFAPDGRYLAGRPLDRAAVAHAAGRWCGRAGRDVLALLALQSGGTCCLDPDGWMVHRREALAALRAPAHANLPDDLDALNPWERHHYA